MLIKRRFEILIVALLTLIGFIYVGVILEGEKHLDVPYNAHTFFIYAEKNDSLPMDLSSFYLDGEVCFVVPHDMPKISTISILDEETFTTYDEEINIDRIDTINDRKIHFIRSNIPSIYISMDHSFSDTPWQDLNNINTEKEVYFPGAMQINTSGAPITYTDSDYSYLKNTKSNKKTYDVTLSRHGNASWLMCSKHSLNLKLTEKDSLLGMYNSKSYTLIANGKDKTLLRNYMANELAKMLGCDYVCDMKFVSLYVDSVYCGVYLLSEKPKKVMEKQMSKNPDSFCVNWLSVDKDYVIPFDFYNGEFEGEDDQSDGNGFSAGLVLPDENPYEMEYYQEKIDKLMREIGSGDFSNVDVDNFINYYWVQEVMKNFDAWYRSAYTVYDADDNIWKQGTPWDFDMTLNYISSDKAVQFTDPYELIGSYGIYADMYKNEYVNEEICEKYNSEVRPALNKLRKQVKSTYNYIYEEGVIDYNTVNSDNGVEIFEDNDLYYGTSYSDAFDKLLSFFDERVSYLDSIFAD